MRFRWVRDAVRHATVGTIYGGGEESC